MADFEKVPIGLSPQQFAAQVRRIANTYQQADTETRQVGADWYPRANQIAAEVGSGDVRKGAGIIAATSPKANWDFNIAVARDIGKRGVRPGEGLQARVTGFNLGRADAIMQGRDPAELLPMEKKTGQFFSNIADPSDPAPVTVDTHAHDIAYGRKLPWATDRGLGAKGRYNQFADAYRTAAQRLNAPTANEVQAVTWSAWRQEHGGKRAA